MSEVTITGLDLTLRVLRQQGDDVAYLALSEINEKNRPVGAARVDFSAVGLGPWLRRGVGDDEEDTDDEDETAEDAAEGAPDEVADLRDALTAGIAPAPTLAVAAMRWIEETVTALMSGRNEGSFKIGLWSPGGKIMLHSARFEAKNPFARSTESDEEADVEAERLSVTKRGADLAPTVHAPAPRPGVVVPEERAWHALGDGYTQLISLTQSTYSHIAKLQSAEIQSLSSQNKRLHETLESVSGDLRAVHIGTAEAQRDEVVDAASAQVRAQLGAQFIDQLGSVGRVYFAAKSGIPPELADIFASIGDSPELMEVLQQPGVVALMKDPAAKLYLAHMLKAAAQQVAAANAKKGAAEENGSSASSAPDDDEPPVAEGGSNAA